MNAATESKPAEPPRRCERLEYMGDKYDCARMFDCCDCGGHDCGCRYCWTCNACDTCKEDTE